MKNRNRVFVLALILIGWGSPASAAWFDNAWPYRITITVQSSQVAADLTNYPVYTDLGHLPTNFWNNVRGANGEDLRITKSDGTTEVPREVIDFNNTSDSGGLYFLADGTLSGSIDTVFYIYYGNTTATEPSSGDAGYAQDVWGAEYVLVHHMQGASASTLEDSTANAQDVTASAGDPTIGAGSLMGNNLELDGTSDYITIPNDASQDTGSELTISQWFYTTTNQSQIGLVKHGPGTTAEYQYMTYLSGDSADLSFYIKTGGVTYLPGYSCGTGCLADGVWHQFVGTYDRSDGTRIKTYFDGTLAGTDVGEDADIDVGAQGITMGRWTGGTFNGNLDEARILNTAKDADWISTDYNNHKTPATFYAIGSQEKAPPGKRKAIIISQFFGNIFDFCQYLW